MPRNVLVVVAIALFMALVLVGGLALTRTDDGRGGPGSAPTDERVRGENGGNDSAPPPTPTP